MSLRRFLDIVFPGQPVFLKDSWIQGVPLRAVFMMGTIARIAGEKRRRPLRLLEVGSWMGASCLTWCEALRLYNQGLGEIVCVDPLVPYFDADVMGSVIENQRAEVVNSQISLLNEMSALLKDDYVYDILMHNVGSVPAPTRTEVIRQPFSQVSSSFESDSFDLVYIDGSHFYDDIKADLDAAIRIVKDGGIICGDDLELQRHEVDLEFAQANRSYDFPTDPRTNAQFHPGVTLAVGEAFGPLINYVGYWAVRRSGTKFTPLNLGRFPCAIPSHFSWSIRYGLLKQLILEEPGLRAAGIEPNLTLPSDMAHLVRAPVKAE